VQLIYNSPNDAKILKEHFTPLKLIFLKFETNPMMDMKGEIILVKNPKACSWILFHELQL